MRGRPRCLVIVLGLLTLGAALLGEVLPPAPQPTIGISSACDLLTSREALSVLGGPVTQHDHAAPLMCAYTLNWRQITSVLFYVIRATPAQPEPSDAPRIPVDIRTNALWAPPNSTVSASLGL